MAKCDRCGKEYKNYYEENWVAMNIVMLYPNIRQSENVIMLCPDCQEELAQWVEKGVQKND